MPQITIPQAAERLGISRYRVWQLVKEGRIVATKLGRDWTLDEQALEAVADRKPGRAGWRKPTT